MLGALKIAIYSGTKATVNPSTKNYKSIQKDYMAYPFSSTISAYTSHLTVIQVI
jgi:hypothetical protein